jgi:hypothetical protein
MNSRSSSVLLAVTLLATAALTTLSPGTEVRVDHAGGGDYLTIKEAVLAASEGDTIWVAEGVYTGDMNRDVSFGTKNLVVRSELGPNLTTINCLDLGRAFNLSGGQDGTSVIRGFTIRNGSGNSGGAIYLQDASPVIENCKFLYCSTTGGSSYGGAVYCRGASSPTITNCQFAENYAIYGGGLGSSTGATPSLEGVVFVDNVAYSRGGGWYCEQPASRVAMSDCVLVGNSVTNGPGGAIYLYEADTAITSVTISGNAGDQAGGIWCYSSSPVVSSSIIAFNTLGKGVACGGESDPVVVHCAVYGNEYGDDLCGSPGENMFVDPRFCDMASDNLTLCANSDCLPENNSWNELVGAAPEGCSACDSPAEATTWGAIKGLYR